MPFYIVKSVPSITSSTAKVKPEKPSNKIPLITKSSGELIKDNNVLDLVEVMKQQRLMTMSLIQNQRTFPSSHIALILCGQSKRWEKGRYGREFCKGNVAWMLLRDPCGNGCYQSSSPYQA